MLIPVLSVRLQARDQVTSPRLHYDGLLVHGDDVRGDFCSIAIRLLPLEEEAGRRKVPRLRRAREVQERESSDWVRICRRCSETGLFTVWTGAGLIYRLSGTRTLGVITVMKKKQNKNE